MAKYIVKRLGVVFARAVAGIYFDLFYGARYPGRHSESNYCLRIRGRCSIRKRPLSG